MPVTINGTTGIAGVDGSNTTPAVRGGTSASNGVFYGTNTVSIATNSTTAVTVDSSQNVGVTITPSAWSSSYKAFEVGRIGSGFFTNSSNGNINFVTNTYINSSNVLTYANSSYAAYYNISASTGTHAWFVAPSGTANTTATFSQAMTLDNSGNLLLGTISNASTAKFLVDKASANSNPVAFLSNSSNTTNGDQAQIWMGAAASSGKAAVFTHVYNSTASSNYFNLSMWGDNATTTGVFIAPSGLIGVNTNAPATAFHCNGTIRYTNRPAAGTITAIGFDANGDLKASSSSLRYKENVQDYTKGLSDVLNIRPVTFTFIGEDKLNAGFIVEEIDQKGLDEFVLRNEDGLPDAIPYGNMVALLTKAIQELSAKLDAAEARIAALEAK